MGIVVQTLVQTGLVLLVSSAFALSLEVAAQRLAVYPLYSKMTERPWTHRERFQFKWFPWFPWTRLENEYLYSPARRMAQATTPGVPRTPPHQWH